MPARGDAPMPDARDGAQAASVEAFLDDLARTPARAPGRRGRLVFALDATMSRRPTWDRACAIQGEMFTEAGKLGGLEVQLVFFRGFRECKASGWTQDGAALARLMSRVDCRGGQTQIARVLDHVLKAQAKAPVNAVVYVGDCCEEGADPLCHKAGELGVRGVPLFMFHEGGDPVAATAFKEMARLSGGAYVNFDSASPETLRQLLRAVAVYAAGGRAALEAQGSAAGVRLLEQVRR